MKYFLFKKERNNLWLDKPTLPLNGFGEKSQAMKNKKHNSTITYKNGGTEIHSENGGNAPLVLMFIDLISRWVFLLLVLFITIKLPLFITILMKIIE